MKSLKLITLLIVALFLTFSANEMAAKGKNTLKIDKEVYQQGKDIVVKFTTEKGLKKNAWIGVIPSNVKHGSEAENDKYDVAYKYLSGKTKGTLKFKAPNKPGKYDIRLNDTDDNGIELESVSFTVK